MPGHPLDPRPHDGELFLAASVLHEQKELAHAHPHELGVVARFVESHEPLRVVRRIHHRSERLAFARQHRRILPQILHVGLHPFGDDSEDVDRQRRSTRERELVDAVHEVRNHLGPLEAALLQSEIGVVDVLDRVAHVVHLDLVGARVERLFRQVEHVLLRDLVGRVEPADVKGASADGLNGEVVAGAREQVILEADDADGDADAVVVRDLDRSPEVKNGRLLHRADLIRQRNARRVGDVPVGVLRVDDDEVHPPRGQRFENAREASARGDVRPHIDAAQHVVLRPTEPSFRRAFRYRVRDCRDVEPVARRDGLVGREPVRDADRFDEVRRKVDARELEVRAGDVGERLSILHVVDDGERAVFALTQRSSFRKMSGEPRRERAVCERRDGSFRFGDVRCDGRSGDRHERRSAHGCVRVTR